MKYLFTTEGSKAQTKYHKFHILDKETGEVLFETVVSSPAFPLELQTTFEYYLNANKYCGSMEISHCATYNEARCAGDIEIISTGTFCRIISNIKPIKHRIALGGKVYEVDADKLEKFLKSLE